MRLLTPAAVLQRLDTAAAAARRLESRRPAATAHPPRDDRVVDGPSRGRRTAPPVGSRRLLGRLHLRRARVDRRRTRVGGRAGRRSRSARRRLAGVAVRRGRRVRLHDARDRARIRRRAARRARRRARDAGCARAYIDALTRRVAPELGGPAQREAAAGSTSSAAICAPPSVISPTSATRISRPTSRGACTSTGGCAASSMRCVSGWTSCSTGCRSRPTMPGRSRGSTTCGRRCGRRTTAPRSSRDSRRPPTCSPRPATSWAPRWPRRPRDSRRSTLGQPDDDTPLLEKSAESFRGRGCAGERRSRLSHWVASRGRDRPDG